MPAHGRIPRTRHLFPEVAAAIIESRRAGLHSTRRIRRAIGVIPLWLVSAAAGVSSLGLTSLLFFLGEPLPAVATPLQSAVQFAPQGEVLPQPAPVPIPYEPPIPPFQPAVNPLLLADLDFTRLPEGWNRERLVTSSAQPPVQAVSYNFLAGEDAWRPARFHESPSLAFQAYVPARNMTGDVAPLLASDIAPSAHSSGDLGMGVIVRKTTPEKVQGRSIFTYEIVLQNVTSQPLDDVVVREKISAIDRVENVVPPADVQQDELVWQLGPLGVQDTRVLRVTLHLDDRPEVLTQTQVIPKSRLASAVAVNLPPQRIPQPQAAPPVTPEKKFPKLELTYTPVTSVKTGEVLSLAFTVKNVGNAPAEDVRLYVQLSSEFQHRFGEHIKNQVMRLDPGQSHTAQLRAIAKQAGDGKLDASLTMKGNRETDRQLMIPIQPGIAAPEQAGPASTEAFMPVPDFEDSLAWQARE